MADDDAPWIIGGILFLAAAFALTNGGTTVPASGSTTSRTTHSTSTATLTSNTVGPRCTAVATVKSHTGTTYVQYPVSAAGSSTCYLQHGNTGMPVSALQRGMALCMDHPLVADGVYGTATGKAVAAVGKTGTVYGPVTAGRMRWPWFNTSTTKFTGHCSPV